MTDGEIREMFESYLQGHFTRLMEGFPSRVALVYQQDPKRVAVLLADARLSVTWKNDADPT